MAQRATSMFGKFGSEFFLFVISDSDVPPQVSKLICRGSIDQSFKLKKHPDRRVEGKPF